MTLSGVYAAEHIFHYRRICKGLRSMSPFSRVRYGIMAPKFRHVGLSGSLSRNGF